MYLNNDGLFQQDNAQCHQAKLAQNWFEEHSVDFQQMVGPLHLPRINPIEHLWYVVERSIYMQESASPNIRNL